MAAGILFIASAVSSRCCACTLLKDAAADRGDAGQVYGLRVRLRGWSASRCVQGSTVARRIVLGLATLGLLLMLAGLVLVVEQQDARAPSCGSWPPRCITIPYLALLGPAGGRGAAPGSGSASAPPSWPSSASAPTRWRRRPSARSSGQCGRAHRRVDGAGDVVRRSESLGLAITPPDELGAARRREPARDATRADASASRTGGRLALVDPARRGADGRAGHGARAPRPHPQRAPEAERTTCEELGVEPVSIGGTEAAEAHGPLPVQGAADARLVRRLARRVALLRPLRLGRPRTGPTRRARLHVAPLEASRSRPSCRRTSRSCALRSRTSPRTSRRPPCARRHRTATPNRKLTAGQVFRLTHRASIEGIAALSAAEKDELGRAHGRALRPPLRARDRARLGVLPGARAARPGGEAGRGRGDGARDEGGHVELPPGVRSRACRRSTRRRSPSAR